MKLSSNYSEVESSNNYKQFSFSKSPAVFKILSDNLYKNKIGSIIRELCSNAKDSHVAAGKKNIPFEVYLPTQQKLLSNESPVFKVIDHGTGLSEEDIYSIYTVYGESNKNNSNKFIGGFGIGSKSPFSYTDEFTIISTYNKKKTGYCAFINSDGIPSITKLYEENTIESNGVEIDIPVNNKDITDFELEYIKQIKYFEPKPKCNKNIVFQPEIYDISKSFWSYKKNYTAKLYVIIGDIEYSIDLDSIFKNTANKIYKFQAVLYFRIPIGTIDLTASRESVSYTEKTKIYLDKTVDKFIKEITLYFIAYSKEHSIYDSSKYAFLLDIPIEVLKLTLYNYCSRITIDKEKLEQYCKDNKITIYTKSGYAKSLKSIFSSFVTAEKDKLIFAPIFSFYETVSTNTNKAIEDSIKEIPNCIVIKSQKGTDLDYIKSIFKNPNITTINIDLDKNRSKSNKTYSIRTAFGFYKNYRNYNLVNNMSLDDIMNLINKENTIVLTAKNDKMTYHKDIKDDDEKLNSIETLLYNAFSLDHCIFNKTIVLTDNIVTNLIKYKNYKYYSYNELYYLILNKVKTIYEPKLKNIKNKENYFIVSSLYKNNIQAKIKRLTYSIFTENEINKLSEKHLLFEILKLCLYYKDISIINYIQWFHKEDLDKYSNKVDIYLELLNEPIITLANSLYCNTESNKLYKESILSYFGLTI